jgi:carboxylesterase type B
MEIPLVFGNLDRFPADILYNRKNIDEAMKLSGVIQGYWVNFAKTGDPNGPGLPDWPRFEPETRLIQVLDVNTRTEPAATYSDKCEFWEEFLEKHGSGFDALTLE